MLQNLYCWVCTLHSFSRNARGKIPLTLDLHDIFCVSLSILKIPFGRTKGEKYKYVNVLTKTGLYSKLKIMCVLDAQT